MADKTLMVRLVSSEKEVYSGEASSAVVPAWDGMMGILPGHAPLIALLGHGELAIDVPGGGSVRYFVAGGVVKVEADVLTILTEYAGAEPPEVIPPEAIVFEEDVAEMAAGVNPRV